VIGLEEGRVVVIVGDPVMGREDGAVVCGDAVGVSVGSFVGVGAFVGDRVVGAFVMGDEDGWDVLGLEDGVAVVGDGVGATVGLLVGDGVGANVGMLVGEKVVGAFVMGDEDGWVVGCAVTGAGATVNSIF
jgi:hypothetical protein